MTSSNEQPQGRASPGHRKAPQSLTTSFFLKPSRKPSELRTPILASPTGDPSSHEAAPPQTSVLPNAGEAPELTIPSTEPIEIPCNNGTQKQKKLAPNTFNNHYRSISRSMNDLGNIFSRGRSPPNRDGPTKQNADSTAPAGSSRRKRQPEAPQASNLVDPVSVPSISVVQHGEQPEKGHLIKEGWVNVIDSGSVKKGPLRDAWRLQHAVLNDNLLMLYKPSSSLQIRAFEIGAGSPLTQRPQSAPATASPVFNVSSLRHKAQSRHPELVINSHGGVQGGTVEALCHELIFTKDGEYVDWAVRTLSGWAGPETALSVLVELSAVNNMSSRNAEIVNILATTTPGLLLEAGTYNCARLLVEKGITPHAPSLAQDCRTILEDTRASLRSALDSSLSAQAPRSMTDTAATLSRSLTADEFLLIDPEVFAIQTHMFHQKYYRAWSPVNDISLLLVSPHLPPPNHRNPLVFNSTGIHFLGERLLDHLLCGDRTSSLERRVQLLTQWLKVAQLLKERGDMVGYLAIAMAALSPPIVRLCETWSNVRADLYQDIATVGGEAMRILERRRLSGNMMKSVDGRVLARRDFGPGVRYEGEIPYFGDLLHYLDDAHASRGRTIDLEKMLVGLQAAMDSVKAWEKCSSGTKLTERNENYVAIGQIQDCLEALNARNQNPPSINSTMFYDKSLQCEPASTGLYLNSHYHQRLPLSTGSNIPLLFTRSPPSFSLFDRNDTLAFSGGSHKKSPSSGLASANPGDYSSLIAGGNQSLKPPLPQGTQTLRRTHSFPPASSSAQTTGYGDLDSTTRERTAVLQGGDRAMLLTLRDVAGVGQQLFHSKDGELVLKAITDELQSRPVSVIENTSKRHSTSSRRYSEVPHGEGIHHEQGSTQRTESPINTCVLVVPKGGTLERLVDILVLGVEDFSKRMNRTDGYELEQLLNLKMNMDVFTITFFATFRSYCSPAVLIDYLKKRLLGSKSAATFSRDEGDDVVFPDWTGIDHVEDGDVDWSLVAKIHVGILDAVDVWISEFFMDFHCDQYLGESFTSFLDVAAREIAIWETVRQNRDNLIPQIDQINSLWQNIQIKFAKSAFAPSVHRGIDIDSTELPTDIPVYSNTDQITSFLETLNDIACRFSSNIQLVDWMLTFELLENQSSDPLGFFVPRLSLLSQAEDEPIQDIFSTLGALKSRHSSSTVLLSLPKSVRDACSFHMGLSNWVMCKLIDPKISVEQRANRIAALLKVLAICRKGMSGMDFYENSDGSVCKHVPSFIGSLVETALLRPECRHYVYAWQLATKMVTGSVGHIETLVQVLPNIDEISTSRAPLTTCVGWMIERLLEIICHVPNMVVENNRLINFDKRRYIYNFINNFTSDRVDSHRSTQGHMGSSPFAVAELFDIRAIKDAAHKENQMSKFGKTKLFSKLLQQEQDKLRRDSKQRDILERQQRQQQRADNRRQPAPMTPNEKRGGKRLGVNSIFKAVRPISMALTGSWAPPQPSGRLVSPPELPLLKTIDHGRKPVCIIDLKSVASISCPRGTRQRFLWKINADNRVSYLLQAPSEKELDEWLKHIATIRGVPTTDGGESIDVMTVASHAVASPQPVFGVSLAELCLRDGTAVPIVVELLLSEIESRGISEVGIYRVPGSLASTNALRSALDGGENVQMDDDRWYDINAIAGAFKQFLRDLPNRPPGAVHLDAMKSITLEISDEAERIPAYRDVMSQLPSHDYCFLRRVYSHFAMIAANAATNKMHAVNLAIVFGMGLCPDANSGLMSPDLGLYQTMAKAWISFADQVFPERPPATPIRESATGLDQMLGGDGESLSSGAVPSPVVSKEDNPSVVTSLGGSA